MPAPFRRRAATLLSLAGLGWLAGLAAAAAALESGAPLFINLGPGDAPFARGFRGSWERDGLNQSGETMFRWTEDGARLEFPVDVRSGHLIARLRLARFLATPAAVTLLCGDRVVDRWTQQPRGWSVRSVDMGEVRGPLTLRFRSSSAEGDLGIALDWVEVLGARALTPAPPVLARIVVFLFGPPLLLFFLLLFFLRGEGRAGAAGRMAPPLFLGAASAVAAALAVRADRMGGLLAVCAAGLPFLLVLLALALVSRLLARAWPKHVSPAALWIALAVALLATLVLSHPFYYYPDIDTHARYLAAIRAAPYLAWDPREYQTRVGSWTRDIGGRHVAFPYSAAFHLLAWPLAPLLGEIAAVKTTAAVAVGFTLLLVHALARALGLGAPVPFIAQGLFALLPVMSSRLTLALFPTLLGQSLDLFLIAYLVRRLPHLSGARDSAAAAFVLLAAQASYTGSLLNVAAFVALLVLLELGSGERLRVVRLLGAYGVAAGIVVGLQYARFLPVFFTQVLPHATEGAGLAVGGGGPGVSGTGAGVGGAGLLASAVSRLSLFYDFVYPALLVPGLLALRRSPPHARRVIVAVLLAGAWLLLLRYTVPAVFRDAKEVELLAPPCAVLAAAGLDWLWERRGAGRVASALAGVTALAWGASRGVAAYAERFVAVGR